MVGAKAHVARASRIWVEGVHDAELVERVWGDDLRIEGIVVERLDGADHLADEVRAFGPHATGGSASCSTTWSPAARRRGSRRGARSATCW